MGGTPEGVPPITVPNAVRITVAAILLLLALPGRLCGYGRGYLLLLCGTDANDGCIADPTFLGGLGDAVPVAVHLDDARASRR